MSTDYDDTTDARKRYWLLVNKERAARGLPPIAEPAPELPPTMQKFKLWNRGGATEAFIAMNDQRVAQGLPPLGANGQPIAPKAKPVTVETEPPVNDPDHPMHDFFSGKVDFEGRPNPDYANVVVKRYSK